MYWNMQHCITAITHILFVFGQIIAPIILIQLKSNAPVFYSPKKTLHNKNYQLVFIVKSEYDHYRH